MKKTTERLRQLLELVSIQNNSPSSADVDELVLLTNLAANLLPDRFREIVVNVDRSSDEAESLRQNAARLLRILDVHSQFSSDIHENADNELLIPTFHLEKRDQARVVELCSEMLKIVFSSDVFDHPHKRRLLDRIAAIEKQVFQERGIFDVVRGGIDDLGETLGKFGVNIKPLTDRMAEVVKITRRATKEYDQLPAPDEVRQLPPPDGPGEAK